MSSLMACAPSAVSAADRLEAETDGLDTVVVGAERVGGQLHLHTQADVLGIRVDVDDVAASAGPVEVDDRGHERDLHTGSGERDDGERLDLAVGRDVDTLEVGPAAVRAGVPAIEVA